MGTIESIVAISGGIVAIVGGLVALWFRLRKRSGDKPSVTADNKSTAIGGDVRNSAVAPGKQSAAAADKGVAIGSEQQGLIVIVQPGAIANVNINTPVRTEKLQASEVPAVREAYKEGVDLQAAERHEEAITAFERAFAAASDERDRADIHIRISTSLLKLGRLRQAEEHLREALRVSGRRENSHER